MRKFLIKAPLLFLLGLIVCIGILSLLGNIFLSKIIHQRLPFPITLLENVQVSPRKIIYIFPNSIIIRDLTLQTGSITAGTKIVSVPTTTLRFSWRDLMKTRQLQFNSIAFYSPSANYLQLQKFIRENFGQLKQVLEKLPRANIMLTLTKGRSALPDGGQLLADFKFILKNNSFYSYGTVFKQTAKGSYEPPLNYETKGMLTDDGFLVDNMSFNQGNVYSNFWGERHNSALAVNGFCFIENEKPSLSLKPGDSPTGILRKVRAFREQRTRITSNTGGLYILDINGNFDFQPALLRIMNLELTLNNIPVKLRGQIAFKDKIETDLNISLYPPPSSATDPASIFKRADVQLTGSISEGRLRTDGSLGIILNPAADNTVFPQQINSNLGAMDLFIDPQARLALRIGTIDISWGQKTPDEHKLAFKDFFATFNFLANRIKILEFQTPFQEGLIRGKLWMDTGQLPTKTTASIFLQDIQAERLQDLLVYFSKIHGRLNGRLNFENPSATLRGDLWVKNGYLLDFDFFKWLAETFALPALHKIDFEHLKTHFTLNQQGVRLDDLDLQSTDTKFKGYFHLDQNSLVASKLSIIFSRELLESSGKTRQILKLFNDDVSLLLFDFQLSGGPDAVNFQWLDNDAKQKIQSAIPNFIQRRIEENIDQTTKTPAENAAP